MPVSLTPLVWRFAPELQSSLCPRTKQQAPCALMDLSYILSKLQTHENHQFMLVEKRKLAGFSSVSQFFLCSFPHTPSSLESTNYNHQRVLSGQSVFKKINVCVCVHVFMFYSCSNEEKTQNNSPKTSLELPLKSAEHNHHSHYSPTTSCCLTTQVVFLK